jgi:FAD synthase
MHGFEVEQMATVADPSGARISSSGVRAALVAGDLDSARAALGRDYLISGHVVHGMKLGRDLGFPTLNLRSRTSVRRSPVFSWFACMA